MERCAYADIIQYRFASPFMTDNLIRWFQAGRNDETRQAHYLICHDYHVLSEAMLRCDCVGICTEPMWIICRSTMNSAALMWTASRDRKSTRLNSSHYCASRMPSSACKTNKHPYKHK